jgi:hypothetical protein
MDSYYNHKVSADFDFFAPKKPVAAKKANGTNGTNGAKNGGMNGASNGIMDEEKNYEFS